MPLNLPIKLTPFPKIFGWSDLAFGERLKLMAFLAQLGGGMTLTSFAGYAMVKLANMKQVWPVFYLGFGALVLVGVVMTGFAGLLIVRTLEIRGPGGFVFKSQDAQAGAEAAQAVLKEMPSVQQPAAKSGGEDPSGGAGGVDSGAGGNPDVRGDNQERGDQPSGQGDK